MESQPQNTEFRNNPENFHPCTHSVKTCSFISKHHWCSMAVHESILASK